MQVTEVANEGLKRAYTVVVPASDIAAERDRRLAELGRELRIPGFRPGKVPASVVKQRYGQAVMGEVLEARVGNAMQQVVTDRGLRPAMQPKVDIVNFADGGDLEFRLDMEVMPEIPMPDFAAISIEKLKAEPSEEQVEKTLAQIAERNRALEDITEERGAAKGEVVVSDFVGRLMEPGPNLLPNAEAAGTEPGKAPEDWRFFAEGPLLVEAAGPAEGGGARVSFRDKDDTSVRRVLLLDVPVKNRISVTQGEVLDVGVDLRVAEGTLPAGVTSELVLPAYDATGKWVGRAITGVQAPGSEWQSAAVELTIPSIPEIAATHFRLRVNIPAGAAASGILEFRTPHVSRVGESKLGEPFPGGTANDMPIEVGGSGFIPGFTEQLDGIKAGETRTLKVSFPADYGAKDLAGKAAEFEVTAKALKKPILPALDDEFAKTLGFDDLAKVKDVLREQLQREYDGLTRLKVKRGLLDALSEKADFPTPEGMVEGEFEQIWQRVEADMKAGRLDEDDKGKDEDTLKAEYRRIAERRVRLGLLLSEIGRTNNITVTQEELARAMRAEAARYPGQEQQVMEFFRKNPQAAENLRSPIFEEKVVDFMLELAQVSEKTVTPEELSQAAQAA